VQPDQSIPNLINPYLYNSRLGKYIAQDLQIKGENSVLRKEC
jgi:hypothetical protein